MSLLRHFLATDIGRFRLAIALWIAVAVVASAVEQAASFGAPLTPRAETMRMVGFFVWLAGVMLSCALVPLIIQLHPAVGSDAFWMTRPIPHRTLVLSKLLLLAALFVGIPVAIEQVVMAIHRMDAGDMAGVAGQTALYRGLLLAALMAVAAVTPNFARFALLCGGPLFAFAMLPVIVLLIDTWRPARGPAMEIGYVSAGSAVHIPVPLADETSSVLGIAVLLGGGVAGMAVQYAGRRVRRSVATIAAAIALAFVVTDRWPWAVMRATAVAPDWSDSPATLQVSADTAAIQFELPPAWHEGEPRWYVRVPVRMTVAPPGWMATMRTLRAAVDLGDGGRFSAHSGGYPSPLPDNEGRQPDDVAVQHVLDVHRVFGGSIPIAANDQSGVMVQLSAEAVSRTKSRTGTFAGEVLVDVTRLEAAATLPLARGTFEDGAYRTSIEEFIETNRGLVVRGRSVSVATMFDRRPRPAYSYFLRNRTRSEALAGSAISSRDQMPFPLVGAFSVSSGSATGFSAHGQMITFDGGYAHREPRVVIDRQWLEGAELVIVRATHHGSVRRTLEIRNFPLRPAVRSRSSAPPG